MNANRHALTNGDAPERAIDKTSKHDISVAGEDEEKSRRARREAELRAMAEDSIDESSVSFEFY
jgi:hypothetical protein